MSRDGVQELRIQMEEALNDASVMRRFYLREGEAVIYDKTTIEHLEGCYTFGHHAVLRMPETPFSLLISTSRQIYGMTLPRNPKTSIDATRRSLAVGRASSDLCAVPSWTDGDEDVDCSVYPSRWSFSDLMQISVEVEERTPAWTAAVNTEEGYLWFSLRNSEQLPSTIVWMENQGRREALWSGRTCSFGLEDVCSYFDMGSEISSGANAFSDRGVKTVHEFQSDVALQVPYIQGAVRVPAGFHRVREVECDRESAVFTDSNGLQVSVSLCAGFLFGEDL